MSSGQHRQADGRQQRALNPLSSTLKVALLTFACIWQSAQAQSLDIQIRKFVTESIHASFGSENVESVAVKILDDRDSKTACANPKMAISQGGRVRAGNMSLVIKCEQDSRAQFIRVQADVWGQYLATKVPMQAGQTIDSQSIEKRSGDLGQVTEGFLTEPDLAVGKVLKRALRAGSALNARDLAQEKIINKGDTVKTRAIGRGFAIERSGVSLKAGGVGDEVPVRIGDKRVVNGIIQPDGSVNVI